MKNQIIKKARMKMNEETNLDTALATDEVIAEEAEEICELGEENQDVDVTIAGNFCGDDCSGESENCTSPEDDLRELERAIPDMKINPAFTKGERYAQLRALGLTAKEAYFAVASSQPRVDNRAHLCTSVPRAARSPGGAMSPRELEAAREIFSGLSDRQIEDLYRKVTK